MTLYLQMSTLILKLAKFSNLCIGSH